MMRVLLVEDDEFSRDMLSRRLMLRGYEVILAQDGEEALVKACSEHPDVILMDLGLPKLDGREVTRRLRTMPEVRHLPVIALTAHAMSDERERAIKAGCDDYDTKPVDMDRLVTKIERFNGVKQAD